MGILRDEIQRLYDVRPSTVESIIDIIEIIDRIAKTEYLKGWTDRGEMCGCDMREGEE